MWVFLLLAGASNAVNLTDGLDGLAAGSGTLVFAAYVLIAFWMFRNPAAFDMIDSGQALDLAVIAGAVMAACAGFLWHNAPPAKIFMGDTGSLALGGLLAALAMATNTQVLLVLLGGLYVAETMSVIIQVFAFRVFGNRVFRMTPIHHHFELWGGRRRRSSSGSGSCPASASRSASGLFYAESVGAGGRRWLTDPHRCPTSPGRWSSAPAARARPPPPRWWPPAWRSSSSTRPPRLPAPTSSPPPARSSSRTPTPPTTSTASTSSSRRPACPSSPT